MKTKLQLAGIALFGVLGVMAQTGRKAAKTNLQMPNASSSQVMHRNCGTQTPPAEWDAWFNAKVEEFKKNIESGKVQMPNYTIPVIVHVIHGGQATGTYPNVSQAQVNSQITVLNNDYAGTGQNVGNLAATGFSTTGAANCNITFCLAQKDPNGVTLTEPGIDRINYVSKGWTNPASPTTPSAFMTLIDNTVKPGSIWDPSRYLNIWITDCNINVGLLGYATFPAGTGLTGLSGFGTATTDGVWCWSKSFGNTGTLQAPFNLGRTASHEIGHWLGLRHIGGDGNNNVAGDCNATDYCNDTPPQKGGFGGGQYGQNYGAPTYPLHANVCAGQTKGDMFMNFMDYTDDPAMYMFTNDQRTRMQTAMANGTYRSQLSTSAGTLCNIPASAPTASFTMPGTGCTNSAVTVVNQSGGSPVPSFSWTANPTSGVSFVPNNLATNPSINFTNPGTYSITVVATNSLGSNSITKSIIINACTTATTCADTLTNFGNTDTLTIYKGAPDAGTPGCSPNSGYVCGSNCYGDKEKAEFYGINKYSNIPNAQIKSVIVLFYKSNNLGTSGNASSTVGLKLYNGTSASSAPTTTFGFASTTLGTILSVPSVSNVNYCGNPSLAFNTAIIKPYRFILPSPVNAPTTGGFFASVVLPTGAADTAVVFNNASASTTTSWELWSDNSWHDIKTAWGGSTDYNLAILPEMQCGGPAGVRANSVLDNNISLFPNPNSGNFSLIATLPDARNVSLTVTNTLGQVIYTNNYNGLYNDVINLDLSNQKAGVYFVTLNDGNEKIVKRLIINK